MKKLYAYTAFVLVLFAVSILFAENASANTVNSGPFDVRAVDVFIDSVFVSGIDSLNRRELDGVILSSGGGLLNEGLIVHDIEAVTEFLHERGWWNAHVTAVVDSSAGKPVILTFNVSTGTRVRFGRVTLKKDKTGGDFTNISPLSLPELYGKSFTKHEVESVVNNIVTIYCENGYPEAKVIPLLNSNADTVDVTFGITAGKLAHIDSIVVIGLAKTKDYVVLRELKHIPGMPADTNAVIEALTAVRRLEFLHPPDTPSIDYTPDGKCLLVIDLEEKGLGSFDGVIGYQPAEGGESGELIGTINLNLANMFGTGRSSSIRWEKLGDQTEDLELRYHEPRVFHLPYNISGSFLQEERERIGYTKTQFDLKIGRHFGHLNIDAGFRYDKVSADSLTSSNATGIEAAIEWNGLDDSDNPRSGLYYSASWSLLSKKYRFGLKSKSTIDNIEVDLDHHIPTFKRQTVAFLLRYRHVDTDRENLDPSDRYWLGGASSIRGYREQQFPAVKALWSSLEYRFITGGASRFFLFMDTGYLIDYISNPESSFVKKTMTITGYGFGLRLRTKTGTLGFDYGLGKGDSPGQGKLHVRLSAEF